MDVDLTSPGGRRVSLPGFLLEPGVGAFRFAPDELGVWTFAARVAGATGARTETGQFTTVPSELAGSPAISPTAPHRLVGRDGAPLRAIGFGDCMLDGNRDGDITDGWGLDGGFRQSHDETGRLVDIDRYLDAYAAGGFDMLRFSVDNCSFKLWDRIEPSGNAYLAREGKWADTILSRFRARGFRVTLAAFGFTPPFTGDAHQQGAVPPYEPSDAEMRAVARYLRYLVARYGAYVDGWELMNEAFAP